MWLKLHERVKILGSSWSFSPVAFLLSSVCREVITVFLPAHKEPDSCQDFGNLPMASLGQGRLMSKYLIYVGRECVMYTLLDAEVLIDFLGVSEAHREE